MQEDLYRVLGVSKDSTEGEIKKSYRKLARELHPDKNAGNKDAEERFKKVSAAYAVLGDKDKRKLYDDYGIDGLRDGFDPEQWRRYGGSPGGMPYGGDGADFGGFSGFGGMENLFETLFGGGGRRGGRQRVHWNGGGAQMEGPQVKSELQIELMDAILGRELQIIVPVDGERKNLKVKIPRGIEDGQSIRLKGQGGQGMYGRPGDMIIEVKTKKNQVYSREGMDLTKKETVTIGQAYLGGPIEVETPWGKGKVNIPAGTQGGQKLRLRGQGIRKGKEQGDLHVLVNIRLPEGRGEEVEDLIKKLEETYI